MNETLHRIRPGVFLAVLGLFYVWIGLFAHGWDRLFAIIGGTLIIAAAPLIHRSARIALGLLLLGSLPLAIATWWSMVTPGLAILTLLMGLFALRRGTGENPRAVNGRPDRAR